MQTPSTSKTKSNKDNKSSKGNRSSGKFGRAKGKRRPRVEIEYEVEHQTSIRTSTY